MGGRRVRRAVLLAAVALVALPARPVAHEVPADVVVRAFVKAENGALWLIVRVPLASMRDAEFPVRGPGYLDIEAARPLLADQAALWLGGYVSLYEGSARLPEPVVAGVRVSLPSDPSFRDYDLALAHVNGPGLPPATDLMLEQAALDVVFRTPVASEQSRFSIDPAWAHLGVRTTTVLRYVTPSGAERAYQYDGNPGRVRLDPRWHQAFARFVSLGFVHILDGIDHLLFLFCLVVPLRRLRPLVAVVTSFTVAHSITLAASALGVAPRAFWFPPLVETLIAASILYMALENILAKKLGRRWAWAFGFGLVHGFGFSFALRESLQFAGSHLYASLLAFNVGVELGQLAALAVMAPGLALLLAKASRPRVAGIVASALAAHVAWHWTAERWGRLTAYDFQPPAWDAASWAAVLRWLMLALIVAGAAWALAGVHRRLGRRLAERRSGRQDTDAAETAAPFHSTGGNDDASRGTQTRQDAEPLPNREPLPSRAMRRQARLHTSRDRRAGRRDRERRGSGEADPGSGDPS